MSGVDGPEIGMINEALPPWPLLSAFIAAGTLLAVTPGPGVFYIVTRSLMQGRRSGLASVAGVALGNLGSALGAAVGLAALFAVSSAAFLLVKYAGAAYLVYLGIRTLRRRSDSVARTGDTATRTARAFRDGFWVAVLNPKTTIFFAAFLPQFMSIDASPVVQGIALGALFVAIAAVTDCVYAVTAGSIAPALRRSAGVQAAARFVGGGTFIALGLFTALSGIRTRA
jgi:threonine/homoserine/homoserine lactone efflux protein